MAHRHFLLATMHCSHATLADCFPPFPPHMCFLIMNKTCSQNVDVDIAASRIHGDLHQKSEILVSMLKQSQVTSCCFVKRIRAFNVSCMNTCSWDLERKLALHRFATEITWSTLGVCIHLMLHIFTCKCSF